MRFTIFTHVEHLLKDNVYFAYAPYIREMNLWLQQVEEVEVVAPLRKEVNFTAEAYRHGQLTFTSVPAFDLLSVKNVLKALFKFPIIFSRTLAAMHRADHLHLRCPGNIGLIACICQVFFPKKPKTAKYAGNWDPKAKQPWTYRLQKWILSNSFITRNMQVLVYGEWEQGSKNVVFFFTASFSEKEIAEVEEKDFSGPLTFLFVGNLVPGKQPLEAIKLVEGINSGEKTANRITLEFYGDGPERERLERYCKAHALEEQVLFYGSRPLQELKKAYQKAHFVILPSRSEGWPKAIAEGMFYGCIPIATHVSCVPWMLDFGIRGILLKNKANGQQLKANSSEQWSVERGQKTEDLGKISQLMKDPQAMLRMSEAAKEWSQQYTLERFEEAIKKVLHKEQRTINNEPQTKECESCN